MANPYHLTAAKKGYHLQPGEVFISREHMQINTVLGSCVAVCLWDQRRKVGGMNHVMLPITPEVEFGTTRYGNVATFVLYDLMRKEGCFPRFLEARVFGGASRLSLAAGSSAESIINVGARNIEVTLKVLQKLKIKIVEKHLGGSEGRKIHFDVQTGRVVMNFIKRFDFSDERNQVLRKSE